ncbi:hypothetical protein GCM10028805_54040 [Spirosoma harenae]
MSGEAILFIYLGTVGSIFLLNIVQWSFFRDWIYGLFTLQTFIWFAHSIYNRASGDVDLLTESQTMALYAVNHGLVKILYLELVYRLFDLRQSQPRLGRWLRWGEISLSVYLVLEVSLMVIDESWQRTLFGTLVLVVFWASLIGISFIGTWIAASRKDIVSWFFLAGSLFMTLSETNNLFYYTGYPWTLSTAPEAVWWHIQILGAGRILLLLCFSLSLVFRQRQIAVNQAISQTRQAEQLVQERLETELAVRRLEQEKTDVQLRALQAQVNPHFLFNSLNSLSSLIDDDPDRANEFVDQLSSVYRYLLKSNDQPLTTLANELDFIQSYYHLLKTRYGAGLSLSLQIDPTYKSYLLPPLTLQLLVENAVKHNTTIKGQPLSIDLFTDGEGNLIIRNNLQRKRKAVLSNGVGLSTIRTHYRNLSQPAPIVTEDENVFMVSIPLIQPVTKAELA